MDLGFSFQKDGPLDMRMDRDGLQPASEWLDHISETDLANVLIDTEKNLVLDALQERL